MKKTNNTSTKEYFRSALRVGEDRLLRNPSRGEQALFICVVVLAFVSLIFTVITAIMSKDAMTIIRAFTENVFMFALITALTVSDRVLVWRGRSLILILYTLLALASAGFAFVGAGGIVIVLAILGVISGIALYGTILFDQFNSADKPIKYWLVYGGALYELLYTLISVIVRGTIASGQQSVANVLAIIVSGLSGVAVILMLIYQFDGFSFAKYLLYEIISNPDEPVDVAAEAKAEQTAPEKQQKVQGFVPYAEQEPVKKTDTLADDNDVKEKNEQAHEQEEQADDIDIVEDDIVSDTEPVSDQELQELSEEIETEDDDAADTSDDQSEQEQPEYDQPEQDQEDILDDFGYVPYDDDAQEDALDRSVKPLTAEPEREEPEDEQDAYEAYEAEGEEADDDDDVLIDESVADIAVGSNVEAIEDIDLSEKQDAPAKMSVKELMESLTPTERKYIKFAMAYHKPADVLQVEGLSGDLFDVWVDGDVICFQNDLGQACDGRGVRTAAVAFADVENIGSANYDGEDCVVLSYYRGDQLIDIGFTKASFKNFKKVMMDCM